MNIWLSRINTALALSFYALFFFVPLVIFQNTYELFEFNKMWVTFGIAVVIFFLWVTKMILSGRFLFKRTPLDIPLGLFLLSQLVSTIFSVDPHVSFWGYYSRFNGGLLSTITYIFLYYAYASNFWGQKTDDTEITGNTIPQRISSFFKSNSIPVTFKFLSVSLVSGSIVALWGLPSHYGYDPTCLMFRGELNVECWTEAFKPTIRMFSTLGQPNWLAAYLSILLIPLIGILTYHIFLENKIYVFFKFRKMIIGITDIFLLIGIVSFYSSLVWTKSQSGFLGFWAGLGFFGFCIMLLLVRKIKPKALIKQNLVHALLKVFIILVLLNVIIGFPIERLNVFTLGNITKKDAPQTQTVQSTETALSELGGTNSGKIRLIVWRGALYVFKSSPLIGTGVESFAFSYYQQRPVEHNVTSEWDYLYNKAHNEYLNYLANSGLFGLGSYLLLIGWFLFTAIKWILRNWRWEMSRDLSGEKIEKKIRLSYPLLNSSPTSKYSLLAISLIGSYVSILVSNFFGFSVVIVNLFFFLLPLFVYDLSNHPSTLTVNQIPSKKTIGMLKILFIGFIAFISIFMEFKLIRYWIADTHYALGYNLNRLDEQVNAMDELITATKLRPDEPLFQDELAINLGTLALIANQSGEASQAAELASQSKMLSDSVVKNHPNNVTFYKSRTRILYGLSEINPEYLDDALVSIERAHVLAPHDPQIMYNRALLNEQAGDREKAISYLKETIKLKKDYKDAYYALALLYKQEAQDNPATAQENLKQARQLIQYSLKHILQNDPQMEKLLNSL